MFAYSRVEEKEFHLIGRYGEISERWIIQRIEQDELRFCMIVTDKDEAGMKLSENMYCGTFFCTEIKDILEISVMRSKVKYWIESNL